MMVRRVIVSVTVGLIVLLGSVGTTQANPNPNGTGQPSASCGAPNALSSPAGFNTGGFSNAESRYAGSLGTPSAANGSPNAVSQYDVACFQVSQNRR